MKRILKGVLLLWGIFISLIFTVYVSAGAEIPGYYETGLVSEKEYSVAFYLDGVCVERKFYRSGDKVSAPSVSVREGYELAGWSLDKNGSVLYDLDRGVNGDVELYAVYKLSPPTFSLSSLSFVYDTMARSISVDNLSHPLKNIASVSFEWYKDGNAIAEYSDRVYVRNVDDSGNYVAKIIFTVGDDSVSVKTPSITVCISKAKISVPEIKSKEYTGDYLLPDITSSALYTVSASGGRECGSYPVKISLADFANYEFIGISNSEINTEFKITKAENIFLEELKIYDVYEGERPTPFAKARFGNIEYLYSASPDGMFSHSYPTKSGTYYAIAKVFGTENYSELVSDPVSFSVIGEFITSAIVKNMPSVTEYRAFDSFDSTGLSLLVTYNSGRSDIIYSDKLSVSYQSEDSLRYGHTAVTVSYLGFNVSVPVSVSKLTYDTSGVIFENTSVVYNGEEQSISYGGNLPIGLDGIPLKCRVLGAGKNAGVYPVVLVFESESANYVIPPSIKTELTILPYETKVIFDGLWFVYDGSIKCPTAYYLDIYGRKNSLTVSGAQVFAGEYTVLASLTDSNYRLMGASVSYTIAKGDYDLSGVYWTSADFVYDGTSKSVTVNGIPNGIKVIGYVDNKATCAGKYIAKAVVTYDERNYNPPPEISLNWEIKKAVYDLSGFSFTDVAVIFDNEPHYPSLVGTMPVGTDGVPLSYRFNKGITHVIEGKAAVDVIFESESTNYDIPESITRFVEILPLGINIIWQNLKFVYSGKESIPSASSNLTEITVQGGAVDAGVYIAVATSLCSDYFIINHSCEFVIEKADNYWLSEPYVSDVFEGRAPAPKAECFDGEVEFIYFSDKECTSKIDPPTASGIYYVLALSEGTKNYSPIVSEILTFEVIKIVPVAFFVTLQNNTFRAFESISEDDFIASVKNNDGSVVNLDKQLISIIYNSEDSFLVGDRSVTFCYLGFSSTLSIVVEKADYDMSSAYWTEGEFYYDGTEKSIQLLGLPDGVEVLSYSGGRAKNVGEYTVKAYFAYDSINYNEPRVQNGLIKIMKQIVALPVVPPLNYSGEFQSPEVCVTELYTVDVTPQKNAGAYFVTFLLKDYRNYAFEGGLPSVEVEYNILPRVLKVTVSSVDKYLFEEPTMPSYTVTEGSIVAGDSLEVEFFMSDNSVYCRSENPNYFLEVTAGELIMHDQLSKEGLLLLFVLILILVFLSFLTAGIVVYRKTVMAYISGLKCRFFKEENKKAIAEKNLLNSSASVIGSKKKEEEIERIMTVSPERADKLITDSLAKNLLRKGGVTIYTDGNKKGIINVDILSENFIAGDHVDVNLLKQKNLIPYDTAYIKVLARGIIDKPLKVYANEFSLSAVKMIALTGGEAIKVNTVRKKAKRKRKF